MEAVTRGGGDLLPRRPPDPGLLCGAPVWGLQVGCRPAPAGEENRRGNRSLTVTASSPQPLSSTVGGEGLIF
jgi:hypothetical protein